MTGRLAAFALATAALLTGGPARSQEAAKDDASLRAPAVEVARPDPTRPRPAPGPQYATFGGGCFWCTEAVFERVPGVLSVVSGYSGGTVPNPTYQMVLSGLTGHAEVVRVEFDPARVSYEALLEVFWKTHDPTTRNAQGPDFGTQYRSVIFYHDPEQKRAAERVHQDLKARRAFKGRVVTQLLPMRSFFPAEAYHQDYYRNHPFERYSRDFIAPKVDKLSRLKLKPVDGEAADKPKAGLEPAGLEPPPEGP